ncbi:hypothetical protein GCM10025857_12350 [Alicyclobacillus contaminans]|nr:hypothetical protein GCM10025857_12350 [Alicyclobacillus contaminans]
MGVELEFFLLKQDARGKPTPEPNDFGGYFDIAPTDAGENCRRDIVLALERMGMDVAGSHHETSPGQHEIDFGLVDILTAADNVATAKLVARTISRKHGLHATFMPKPLQDEDGCSMHCHFVLPAERSSADRGKAREDGTFSLSRTVQSYIAGLLRHAPALTCITNPVVNSYKRLVPGFEAPSHIFWSTRHRMPFIRVAVEEGTGVKIELRSPDPSCNPYLAFAVALKAGLDGVQNDMDAPPPVYASVASMSEEERFREGIATLPRNLEQALEALEEDEIIRDALGEHAYHHFVQAKLLEWEQYEKTVHPWEWEQYLTL